MAPKLHVLKNVPARFLKSASVFLFVLCLGADLFAITIPRVRSRYQFYNCRDYETRCTAGTGPSAFCAAARSTCEDLRYIYQLELFPNAPNKIMVRAGVQPNLPIYFSFDTGRSWMRVFNPVSYALGINSRGTALTADENGNIYESRDQINWRRISTFTGGSIRAFVFDKNNDRKVYMSVQLSGNPPPADAASIHISEDGGRTFTPSPFNLPTDQWPVNRWIVWAIGQNRNDGTLFAGMEYEGGRETRPNPYHAPLLRSTDGGASWENVYTEVRGHIVDIEVDEANNIIYAHNEGQDLYKSLDNGDSWEAILWPYAYNIAINPSNPNELFFGETFEEECAAIGGCLLDAGTYGLGRVWQTPDGAATFEAFYETGGLQVSDMAVSRNGATLYVATYGQGLHQFAITE